MEGSAENGAAAKIGRVLLLEDNMLIALDTEDVLLDAGVGSVAVVSTSAAALDEMARERPDFALLDFNLGTETSERVAEALTEAGIPFCFATGYGDAMVELAVQPPFGVLKKPYSPDDIAQVLARVAAS